MADSYKDILKRIADNPPIPQPPKEEKYLGTIYFPDADATPEEVDKIINGDEEFLKGSSE